VILVIVQGFLVGRAVKALGEHHIVPISLAIVAVGLLMIPGTTSVGAMLAANGVLALGMGFNNPALMALISKHSAAEDQGGVLGLTQSLNSLARIVGPMWGGYTFDHIGIGAPYVSSAAVMAVACALSVAALWRQRAGAES
jgi:predicted MFS family arabinose efflux permease